MFLQKQAEAKRPNQSCIEVLRNLEPLFLYTCTLLYICIYKGPASSWFKIKLFLRLLLQDFQYLTINYRAYYDTIIKFSVMIDMIKYFFQLKKYVICRYTVCSTFPAHFCSFFFFREREPNNFYSHYHIMYVAGSSDLSAEIKNLETRNPLKKIFSNLRI